MASKHFTSSTVQAQAQPREPDTQNFGNPMYQYERGKLEIKNWIYIFTVFFILKLNRFHLFYSKIFKKYSSFECKKAKSKWIRVPYEQN